MNYISIARVVLVTLITFVIFVLSGICICYAKGNCQMLNSYVCTNRIDFVNKICRFLFFNSLKTHLNFFLLQRTLSARYPLLLRSRSFDGTDEIEMRCVMLTL